MHSVKKKCHLTFVFSDNIENGNTLFSCFACHTNDQMIEYSKEHCTVMYNAIKPSCKTSKIQMPVLVLVNGMAYVT